MCSGVVIQWVGLGCCLLVLAFGVVAFGSFCLWLDELREARELRERQANIIPFIPLRRRAEPEVIMRMRYHGHDDE